MKSTILATAIAALAMPGIMQEAEAAASAGAPATDTKAKKEREVAKVTMKDGREVEFVGKRKLLKDVMIDGSSVSVRLDFKNGESILFKVPDDLLLRSAGHGMSQKLGDETAGEDDVDDMFLAVDDLVKRLGDTSKSADDRWTARKEGTGFAGASLLVKALAEVTGKSQDEVKAFLKAQVDAGTTYAKLSAAFEEDSDVGPVIKRMRKEKAGETKVDTSALKGSLASFTAPAPAAA